MQEASHPVKVPTMVNYAVSALMPVAAAVVMFVLRRNQHDLHHAILGLLQASCISHSWSVMLKQIAGKPRPDFINRCKPVPLTAEGSRIDTHGMDPVQYLINLQKDYATFFDAQNFECTDGDADQARKSFPAVSDYMFTGLGVL